MFAALDGIEPIWHRESMTLRVVDLSEAARYSWPDGETDVLIACGDPRRSGADQWLERSTFALTETDSDDRRCVQVPSVSDALADIEERAARWPQAAAVCDDVLRAVDVAAPALAGLTTESLAYSTLQSGREFARWLTDRGPAAAESSVEPVVVAERVGNCLMVQLNRPTKHNAFSTNMRAALLEALAVAELDTTVTQVVLSGAGPSFCSGGDLAEFGTFADPVSAHFARTRHSPALTLEALTRRLGRACGAEIHGRVLGSGLEMAAFCGHVVCRPDAVLGLPELKLGLIPGAGGTVSVTRRIGRWRTAYLVLTGRTIDATTALRWGLVDVVEA
jgi:enoyl-CoA hydratase/carnithine racemase